jgi:hypothetical protein
MKAKCSHRWHGNEQACYVPSKLEAGGMDRWGWWMKFTHSIGFWISFVDQGVTQWYSARLTCTRACVPPPAMQKKKKIFCNRHDFFSRTLHYMTWFIVLFVKIRLWKNKISTNLVKIQLAFISDSWVRRIPSMKLKSALQDRGWWCTPVIPASGRLR